MDPRKTQQHLSYGGSFGGASFAPSVQAPALKSAVTIQVRDDVQGLSDKVHHQASHTRKDSGVPFKDAYRVEDLDDEWAAILSELDDMLVAQGAHCMTEVERSTAVRKLIECTATKGPAAALSAARDAVLRARPRMPMAVQNSSSRYGQQEVRVTQKEEDLDDEWTAILAELDDMLVAQGAHRMTEMERNTAMRKLIECTATKGPAAALAAARDAVLRARRWQ
jgi:hypothetical protein